jgi:hypothetical protein
MDEKKIAAENIDCGFEFNGWYMYDPNYKQESDKSWWWVRDDEYIVAFGAIPGYEDVRQYKYHSVLSRGDHAIHVLQKVAPL